MMDKKNTVPALRELLLRGRVVDSPISRAMDIVSGDDIRRLGNLGDGVDQDLFSFLSFSKIFFDESPDPVEDVSEVLLSVSVSKDGFLLKEVFREMFQDRQMGASQGAQE